MEVFEKFCEFYVENKFTDLCVVSGQDNDQVFCHSLILTSAVPGLKDLLRDSHESQEDRSTIILPDISGLELKEAVSDIYNSLIQVRPKGLDQGFPGCLDVKAIFHLSQKNG